MGQVGNIARPLILFSSFAYQNVTKRALEIYLIQYLAEITTYNQQQSMARIVHSFFTINARILTFYHAVATMQTKIIRFFLFLICFLPSLALAATPQTIHIEWGYTPPASPAVTGFKLYQEGAFVCQAGDPAATAMDCLVSLTQDTTNFTLTATFDDGTESPHSAPFPFTTSDDLPGCPPPPPEEQGTGSKLFTFKWTAPADSTGIKGYRVYLNNALLCETTNPSATTLSCKADLLQETMVFSMTQVTTSGSESAPSNLLDFDPTAYPELFANTKQFTFSWEYNQTTAIKGFRIYQNSFLICQTNDPSARQLTCTTDLAAPAAYTLTAVNADDSETGFSNALTYTGSTGTDTGEQEQTLKAIIAANIVNGEAPLSVAFNGTSSTGKVTSYRWDFGDGSVASTSTANHTYATAGTYTAKLTIGNSAGATNTTTIAITASSPVIVAPTPPTAVISSSTAMGPAPLTVSFDGSGSVATNATIASYTWSFGDGASGTGITASHAYTSAGTYNATLTVIDNKGQSSWATTPVVVTAPVTNTKPPQAVISATPSVGSAPLTVIFNGGGSTADGSINSYVWNFGDGGTATGKSVTHTYTTAATFTATLQVTDDRGATGVTRVTITAKTELPEPPTTGVKIETGEIAVSSDWVRVPLATSFTDPIVIAGPPSFNNAEPCTVRIRNVNKTGFDIKITEWDYLDGKHPQETVSYLVMEKGQHTLPDGSAVEAGSFTGSASSKTVTFGSAFAKAPVVLAAVTSMNDVKTVSGRIKSITTSRFMYQYQEQEKNNNKHLDETVHYIAWQPGSGTVDTLRYTVATTANSVTDGWYSEKYKNAFSQTPLLMADMQTTNDTSPAALRVQNQTATGFQVKAEAEMSKNNKTKHSAESVGYIALDQPMEKVLATFKWTFDTNQEGSINGFQILANGELVCASDNPSVRQLSCEMNKPASQTTFTIQTINTTGGVGSPSNSITYRP